MIGKVAILLQGIFINDVTSSNLTIDIYDILMNIGKTKITALLPYFVPCFICFINLDVTERQ